jgi:Ca2+-binding RTX toxin-like protein
MSRTARNLASRSHYARVSSSRAALAALTILALVSAFLIAAQPSRRAEAATPSSGTIGPPDGSTLTFTGTISGAVENAGGTQACAPPSPACDHYSLTVSVAPTYWDTHFGGVTVRITWPDGGDDVDLYVFDKDGAQAGSSTSGAGTSETVVVRGASSASSPYEVRVVPALVISGPSTPYSGTVTFNSIDGGAPPGPPRQTGGLAFGPATVVDAQRTEGEPLNFISPPTAAFPNGEYWESGPWGTHTQQSFIHRSVDGGDQFNIVSPIGIRPDSPPGGGDTDIVTDDQGNAYWVDLEGLTNFGCAVSNDHGNTWRKNTECVQNTAVDRQWLAIDNGSNTSVGAAGAADNTVFLSFHVTAVGIFIYSSPGATGPTDPTGGLLFTNAAGPNQNLGSDARCGQIRFDPLNRNLYYPCGSGDQVRITVGHVGVGQRTGISFTNVLTPHSPAGGSTSASLFPDVAVDAAGNVYAVWIDGSDNNVYYSYVPDPGTGTPAFSSTMATSKWSAPVRINGNDALTSVMPWVQGGVSGRIAVAWYGSTDPTPPDSMTSWFNNRAGATAYKWYGYASIIQDADTASPTIYQQRFTETPMNYGQVCTSGTTCIASGGDRTMADFFGFYADPLDGALRIVYNDTTSQHHGAHLFEQRQLAGPTLLGPTINKPAPPNPMTDPQGDAQVPHYGPTGAGASQDRFDFTNVKLSQTDKDTLRVEMTLKNLSSLAPPTGKTNAVWLTRFQALSVGDPPAEEEAYRIFYVGAESVNGAAPTFFAGSGNSNSGPMGSTPGNGCANTLPGAAAGCKLILYPAEVAADPTSNLTGNKITIDVKIQGGFGPDRPIKGDRLYNATAFTFGRNAAEDFYTDIDSTRSFDFPLLTSICDIIGTAGNDTLVGTSASEVICGLGGNDLLRGLGGNDILLGGDGKDTLFGGTGNDVFDGGTGVDTTSFADGPVASGVTANLATGTSTNAQLGNDTFVPVSPGGCSTVENLTGSGFDDSFTGDACNNTLYGANGGDTLTGGGGADLLQGVAGNDSLSGGDGNDLLEPGTGNDPSADGGNGFDTLAYVDITTGGVNINLVGGTATGTTTGGAGADHFTAASFEAYYGTNQADTLTGDTGSNLLYGLGGADAISGQGGNDTMGGGAGADSIDGGGGVDSSTYYTAPGGATVDLAAGTASADGTGSADSLVSVENALGSNAGGDNIAGSDGSNALYGFGGNDSLSGRAGNDYLDGGAGTDSLNGGNGTDRCLNGEGTLVDCESTSSPLRGSSVGTSITLVIKAEARMARLMGQAGSASGSSDTIRPAGKR